MDYHNPRTEMDAKFTPCILRRDPYTINLLTVFKFLSIIFNIWWHQKVYDGISKLQIISINIWTRFKNSWQLSVLSSLWRYWIPSVIILIACFPRYLIISGITFLFPAYSRTYGFLIVVLTHHTVSVVLSHTFMFLIHPLLQWVSPYFLSFSSVVASSLQIFPFFCISSRLSKSFSLIFFERYPLE